MKVAIYGRAVNENLSDAVQGLFDELDEMKAEVFVHDALFSFLQLGIRLSKQVKTISTHQHLLDANIDFLLSLGGDGTFLETILLVRNSGIPVLGINTGRLGFLANVVKEEIKASIRLLKQKKYRLDERTLLRVEGNGQLLFGDTPYGLNEMTILKKDISSMITINTWINGEFLNAYWADGLIIATPTGSTAYSLSCGGPIVAPGSRNFVITPIASHNLNVRPVIIPDDSEITLKVQGRGQQYMVSLDSRFEIIDDTIEIRVKKENFVFNTIKPDNQHFFSTLRNKLLWGLDKRN